MKKNILCTSVVLVLAALNFMSCNSGKKSTSSYENIQTIQKKHSWFYFTETGFEKVSLPQEAPEILQKPWTESTRISSAASLPYGGHTVPYGAYAVVNRLGILAFTESGAELYSDSSIFSQDTADSLVFSAGIPVFYLYQSSFFNTKTRDESKQLQSSRPFLVEFNPASKICYPLVSYENLGLSDSDQITGFFWNGETWTCSAKKETAGTVSFSYFNWKPLIDLTDLSPALTSNAFSFSPTTEDEYKQINMPKLFESAPVELKELFKFIPEELTFYVSWRNTSGNSELKYFQQGNNNIPLNAKASIIPLSNMTAAVFADGTTYIKKNGEEKITAFRLPLLPAGFTYGEFAVSGKTLFVAWEEAAFYKTGRAGFISVSLEDLI